MSAIEASSVRVQTMADGTLRLTLDYPPASAQAAFRMFGAPGTPVATARIKTAPERTASSSEKDKPKGGALAKLAGQWCADDKFMRFMRPLYDRHMGGDGSGWGDVTPHDFGGNSAGQRGYLRHCVLVLCAVQSRAELDHSAEAAAKFHTLIREPFAAYLRDNQGTTNVQRREATGHDAARKGRVMNRDLWDYIRRMSEQHKARFIRCDGTLYEVTKIHRPTGPSPQWSIEPVRPKDVSSFERGEGD